jgi:hypothetical protein
MLGAENGDRLTDLWRRPRSVGPGLLIGSGNTHPKRIYPSFLLDSFRMASTKLQMSKPHLSAASTLDRTPTGSSTLGERTSPPPSMLRRYEQEISQMVNLHRLPTWMSSYGADKYL